MSALVNPNVVLHLKAFRRILLVVKKEEEKKRRRRRREDNTHTHTHTHTHKGINKEDNANIYRGSVTGDIYAGHCDRSPEKVSVPCLAVTEPQEKACLAVTKPRRRFLLLALQ